jgi:predicted RNA binding protein YcfA (HicA-like mRNA interferase family)
MFDPVTDRLVVVPVHPRELPRWLVKKIIKDAGLTDGEFRDLL